MVVTGSDSVGAGVLDPLFIIFILFPTFKVKWMPNPQRVFASDEYPAGDAAYCNPLS